MTLKEAKAANVKIFREWRAWGVPEAYSKLNDSNRDVINAFIDKYPNAMCIKFGKENVSEYLFTASEDKHHYNFCCDVIFNPTEEIMGGIKDVVENLCSEFTVRELKRLYSLLSKTDNEYLVWS